MMVSKVLISFDQKLIFFARYQSFIIIYREPRIMGVETEFENS